MRIIACGCCDNVLIFEKKIGNRCNDYIVPLPFWKRLVQILLGVRRENAKEMGSHAIPNWKLKILSKVITHSPEDAPWKWVQ